MQNGPSSFSAGHKAAPCSSIPAFPIHVLIGTCWEVVSHRSWDSNPPSYPLGHWGPVLALLSSTASVSQALMHNNPYLPQKRHLPALKPYLLGRDKVFNAVWQTPIRYNSTQGISPANRAAVPKKTCVPVSARSTLTPAVPRSSVPHRARYLRLPHRAFCCCARHSGIAGCAALAS